MNDLFSNIQLRKTNKQPLNILNFFQTQTNFQISKCNKPRCKTCNIIIPYKNFIEFNNKIIYINNNGHCQSRNVIYCIRCNCNEFYIGKATQFNLRINLHRDQTIHPEKTILKANKHMRTCQSKYQCTILFILSEEDDIFIDQMEDYFIKLIKPGLNAL